MKIVVISDTHTKHLDVKIPDGDVLIHCGDWCIHGSAVEALHFAHWFEAQPHKHKICIAGNHDFVMQDDPEAVEFVFKETHYLRDSHVSIEGKWFYGSPWTPEFCGWAFMKEESVIGYTWDLIPEGTDVLITHGPPRGILDTNPGGGQCGSESLYHRVQVVKPKLHVFGHIHHNYGIMKVGDTIYGNASTCDERYKPTREPLVFNL